MSDRSDRSLPILAGGAYEQVYLVLAGLFIAALVACNLIFQKFFVFEIPLLGGSTYTFRQSVGILAYPLTFLVTDILSEIYGARRANQVVIAGLLASVFTTGLVELADVSRSAEFGIGDETFHQVFGLSKIAVFASMMAYLTAQFIDIRLFHFWKRLTRGKHLWLRNNASTITSQTVDTFVVLALLASFNAAGITWESLPALFVDGLLFKWAFAAIDTPLFYGAVALLKKRFPEQTAVVDAAEVA
jgi:queuosine precursor transporter